MSLIATVRATLLIADSVTGIGKYNSPLSGFQIAVAGAAGPTPGSVLCATAGTTISLAQLTALGGWCEITNLDPMNYVTWGIFVGGSVFAPVSDILPGEKSGPFRLAQAFLGGGNLLRIVANTASCQVIVSAFDK